MQEEDYPPAAAGKQGASDVEKTIYNLQVKLKFMKKTEHKNYFEFQE